MKNKKVLAFSFLIFFAPSCLTYAYWVWSPEQGKFVSPDKSVDDPAEAHYEYAMQLYREKKTKDAIRQLQDLLKKHRGSSIAPEAQYQLGVLEEEQGDYLKAFESYKVLIESYPQSQRVDEVVEREFRIGNLFLSGRKAKFMGLEIVPSMAKAVEIFDHIVKNAPYGKFGDQAQFRKGLAYKKAGDFDSAIEAFQAVVDNYPQSDLVAESRFQLADVSFLRSNSAMRDQRALDSASQYVDRFLTRYPDSSVSEKAAKLRQEIDEKNAEKNFRIGRYYEKTNYLTSALIYYAEVAERYPHTVWGEKAKQKMESLKEPVSYLKDQREKLANEIRELEAKLAGLDKKSVEYGMIERQIERIKEKERALEKTKSESVKSREEDIKRREREMKEKIQKLELKKKLLKTNQSEDFKRAIDRWQAALDEERRALEEEKRQLREWKESLGIRDHRLLEMLPFIGEGPTEIEKVRRIEARRLYRISNEKKNLLTEKELLYKQLSEVEDLLKNVESSRLGLGTEEEEFQELMAAGGAELRERQASLKGLRSEIVEAEKTLSEKSLAYEKQYGESIWASWMKASSKVLSRATETLASSMETVNPFQDRQAGDEGKSIGELLELKMHLDEKIAAQTNLVNSLSQAFNYELAAQEQKRLLASLESQEKVDAHALRKSVKQLEKEIRARYEEIEDRHEQKKAHVKELERIFEQQRNQASTGVRVGRALTSPLRLFYQGGRDFILGRTPTDLKVTRTADALTQDDELSRKARELSEEIELHSLVIEVKNREIFQLRKDLEILKAKAALDGGYQFRSAMVGIPYQFLEEAVESAARIVPKKDRQEILINRLNKETKDLEEARLQLKKVEEELASKSQPAEASAPPTLPSSVAPSVQPDSPISARPSLTPADEALFKEEIQNLQTRLEQKREAFERQKLELEKELDTLRRESSQTEAVKAWDKRDREMKGQEEVLKKEWQQIQKELRVLIQKEEQMEQEEHTVLGKRIEWIDKAVKKISSKATVQDLLKERGQMEERLLQIETRRNFLARESERFRVA